MIRELEPIPRHLSSPRWRSSSRRSGRPRLLCQTPRRVNAVLRFAETSTTRRSRSPRTSTTRRATALDYTCSAAGRKSCGRGPGPHRPRRTWWSTRAGKSHRAPAAPLIENHTPANGPILPIDRINRRALARGIDTLVEARIAPGQIPPRSAKRLGAAYYNNRQLPQMGLRAEGAGFLYVARNRQRIDPPHHQSPLPSKRGQRNSASRFLLES